MRLDACDEAEDEAADASDTDHYRTEHNDEGGQEHQSDVTNSHILVGDKESCRDNHLDDRGHESDDAA